MHFFCSSVFLQLFYHGGFDGFVERPIMLPLHKEEMHRAINVLDWIQPQENHKIGVIYLGNGQTSEQDILSNTCGSFRYSLFIQVNILFTFFYFQLNL